MSLCSGRRVPTVQCSSVVVTRPTDLHIFAEAAIPHTCENIAAQLKICDTNIHVSHDDHCSRDDLKVYW